MAQTYKRAVFLGPKQIRIDEVPIPEPGPRQALVKVRACALCTFEQREYSGEEKMYPLAGGHEVSGELVKLGGQVYSDAKVGDRVVASRLTRCGYCESCRRGLDSNCDNARKSFNNSDVPGPAGLAEYVLLEDYQLYKANNARSFEEISLSEPLACVTRSVRAARIDRGDTVLIIGAGIMGMLHLALVKQVGVRVIVSEPDAARAAFATRMGADVIVNPKAENFVERIKELTGGRGADVIFCAIGIAPLIEQAMQVAAKGGRVQVYASVHPRGSTITIDPNLFHGKEIVLSGTISQSRGDMLEAVRMISDGIVDLQPFVSTVLPFDRLEEAFAAAMRMDTYRVVVTM